MKVDLQYILLLAFQNRNTIKYVEVGENDANGCKTVIFGKEIENDVREIENGVREIENGVKEIENSLREIENGVREIESGLREIENGLREIENDTREIENGVRKTDYLIFQHGLKRPRMYCCYIVLESYHLSIYQFSLEVGFDLLCHQ